MPHSVLWLVKSAKKKHTGSWRTLIERFMPCVRKWWSTSMRCYPLDGFFDLTLPARTNLDPSLNNKKPEVKSIRVVHTCARWRWGVRKIHGRSFLGGLSQFPNPCVSPGVEASSPLPHLLQEALQPSLPTSLRLQKTRNLTLFPCLLQMRNSHPAWLSRWAWTLLTDSSTKIRVPQSCLFHPWAEW